MWIRTSNRLGAALSALLAAASVAALWPAVAHASTASISGGVLQIAGGPESSNISFGGNSFLQRYIVDTAGITAGPGCTQMDATKVECDNALYTQIVAQLGGGDDTFAAGGAVFNTATTVNGDAGNDTIYGTDANDTINGGDGNDSVTGNSANDTVDGGPGDDDVRGGGGSDRVIGGPGRDTVNGDGPEVLDDGNDTIDVNDGELDQVQCGFGADIVNADALDVADASSCEQVNRPAAPVGQPAAPTMRLALGAAASRVKIATVLRSGYRFTCGFNAAGRFRAELFITSTQARKLKLGRKGVAIASVGGSIDADRYAVRLRVSKSRYRAALRRARRVTASLIVVAASSAGKVDSTTRRVTLVR